MEIYETSSWAYEGSGTDPLRISFNAGYIENCCDRLIIYDGTNNAASVLFDSYNASFVGNDLTGQIFTASGINLFMTFVSDVSANCSGNTPWDYDVFCLPCTSPTATFTTVPNCVNNQYSIAVNVTNMGDASTLDVLNASSVSIGTITGTGISTFGPYTSGTTQSLTLAHNLNSICNVTQTGITYMCPPANDECAGAYVATVNPDYNCGSVVSATFAGASNSVDAESCFGAFGSDLWFSFTATATSHRITTINTSAYVDFNYQVLDGCGGTSLLCQDSPNNQIDLTGLTIGNTYLVRVGAYSSTYTSSVTFDFCVGTPPPPPANDAICNAILLTVDAAPTVGNNSLSTGEVGEPNGSCWFGGTTMNSVWYKFVANASSLNISTDFVTGLTDGHIALYNNITNCANMATLGTEVGCSEDDGVLGFGYNSIINATGLTIGNTYYVQFDGYGTNVGDFKIQVTTLPPAGSFVWTGASSTSWTATGNWLGGVAPTVCADNVFIQSSGYNPNLTANFTCGNLETQAGAAMTIASGSSLTVCGNMNLKSGTTINGSVILDGINVAVTGNATVGKLTANAATTTMSSGTLNISEGLVLNNTFTNNGTVVLKSTATGTAYLDDFTNNSASYVGNLDVEMFVTAGGDAVGQRFFGSAVSGSSAAGLNMTYATGYPMGQLIPDVCGTSLLYTSPYSNLFSWNQAATLLSGCNFSAWTAIPGSSSLTPGRGYSGWMNDGSIVKVSGAPNTGNVSFALSANNTSTSSLVNGWHLLSNPYPSPIAVNALINSGLTSPSIYDGNTSILWYIYTCSFGWKFGINARIIC